MNNEQIEQEIANCNQKILALKSSIEICTQRYDQIRYNYERQYVEVRWALKKKIEERTNKLKFLQNKLFILMNFTINLQEIELEQLDNFVKESKFKNIY